MPKRPTADEIGEWGEEVVKEHLRDVYGAFVLLSRGSRTSADVKAYFRDKERTVWFIQVKASFNVPARPSPAVKRGLIQRAANRGAVPLYARVWLSFKNGDIYYKVVYYDASTDKVFLRYP